MKYFRVRLDLLEKSFLQQLLKKNLAQLPVTTQTHSRRQDLSRMIDSLSGLSQRKSFFGKQYYEWALTGSDVRQTLLEVNEGRNRDIREGFPTTETNQLMIKLAEPKEIKNPGPMVKEACR